MKKVTVTRRGRKKKDQAFPSNDLQNGEFDVQMEAICDAPLNTQLSNAPELLRTNLPRYRGAGATYYLGLEIEYHATHY